MPKVIKSPVKHFAGTVTLYEPLTMPQVVAIDDALLARREFFEDTEINGEHVFVLRQDIKWSKPNSVVLDAIINCVQEWDLKNFPETVTSETFPGSPRQASKELNNWLLIEILNVYNGELEIPNE